MEWSKENGYNAVPQREHLKVRLHPFLHQVSGSTLLFNFDRNTICKPLLQNEYLFYRNMPDTLRAFTAEYRGSIAIETESTDDGMCRFFGSVPASQISMLNVNIRKEHDLGRYFDFLSSADTALRLKRSGSIELDAGSIGSYTDPSTKIEAGCRLSKRLNLLLEGDQHKFILLENLVSKFKCPSILDLKMGTRTHADDDAEEKKLQKIRKANDSTSATLGVRLHGMQKYNSTSGKYETLDKRDGLRMKNEDFSHAMNQFFNDGLTYRSELITPVVHKLRDYYNCISQQDSFRFYSSSLLIIYDGAAGQAHVNVKAIDFAHTVYPEIAVLQSEPYRGPDVGYLRGIKSVIDILSN